MARKRTSASLLVLLVGVVLTLAPAALADVQPVLDLTGGGSATVPLSPSVAGWSFHLDNAITIGSVGIWDEGKRPLNIAHEIGLYTSTQQLLLDAFVTNGNSMAVGSASPDGQWLFTPIAPLVLAPGDYVLAATWGDISDNADPFRYNANAVDPFVNYTGECIKTGLDYLHLVFPDCGGAPLDRASFFGPNLGLVPEPASLTLLALGVLAAGRTLRRRL